MIDPTELGTEISTDPEGLGLGELYDEGQYQGVANALNSLTGPGAASINLPSVSKDNFILAIAPALLVIPTLSSDLQTKWNLILNTVLGVNLIDLTNSNVTDLLEDAVSDGVLTSDQVTAATTRIGSRAEVLWGAGTVVSAEDVSLAITG